jgi:hypothetical protein
MRTYEGYTVTYLLLDPEIEWKCQSTRHTIIIPPAIFLLLITVGDTLTVHSAMYVCSRCRRWMEADLSQETEKDETRETPPDRGGRNLSVGAVGYRARARLGPGR